MLELLLAVFAAAGIPGAIVGFLVWGMQRKILNRDKQKERDEERHRKELETKERDREQLEIYLIESINASITLSEATARAVQRIPDAHCNGDMHKALAQVETVRQNQRDFLMKKGVHSIL